MTATSTVVNPPASCGIAQIANVGVCYEAIARTRERNRLLPGIAAYYGPSGFGKSVSANYVANKEDAYYVQAKSTGSKKSFLQSILREMSIAPYNTIAEMSEQIATELAKSGRPLIIDEFDHLVTSGKVEMVRDIYESSQSTILIIGEELLPRKLERWERFHGRILTWVPALPASVVDAQLLAPIYAPQTQIAEEVLEKLVAQVRGSVRRVCTNLEMLNEACLENGRDTVTSSSLLELMPGGFITGESPKPRSF